MSEFRIFRRISGTVLWLQDPFGTAQHVFVLFTIFNSSDVCVNDAAAKAEMGSALLSVGFQNVVKPFDWSFVNLGFCDSLIEGRVVV